VVIVARSELDRDRTKFESINIRNKLKVIQVVQCISSLLFL